MTVSPDSGYMGWCWADDPDVRKDAKRDLDRLADGVVQSRGIYLFHPDKYDQIIALRKKYEQPDSGVVLLVYDQLI